MRVGLAVLVAAVAVAAGVAPAAAAPRTVAASDAGLAPQARRVALGEELVVEGLWLERDAAPVALELERVAVWAPGAVVEIDGERRPAPASAVFRGRARGWLDSIAVLTVSAAGETDGLVLREGRAWVLGGRGGGLASLTADLGALDKPFECGNEDDGFRRLAEAVRAGDPLADVPGAAAAGPPAADEPFATEPSAASRATAASHAAAPYTATLALETDSEYYSRFLGRPDPVAAALDYLATLVAYADLVYSREIDTAMEIGYARLWTGGAAADPWTANSTVDLLLQFQDYWNLEMRSVARTAAHFVSGKALGGGVAYVGSLCESHLAPGSSYDYGVSASISGSFSWNGDPASDPAAVVWDIVVVLHEIGHNFDSPHSHDYCGLGGSSQAIDRCYASQVCGTAATGLPSCSSPTPHFAGGAGTIMSYCHLGRGMQAIALTFGEGHTCGVLPWRQADRMSAHVASRAASAPGCFAGSAPTCPADAYEGLGSGGTDDTCSGGDIAVGAPQTRTLCDEDWAWFNPIPGATYRIETSALTGGADTTLAVHQQCGPQLAFDDDAPGLGAASRIEWTAPSDAAADVRVRSAGAYGADDGYTLSVTCIADCDSGCPASLTLSSQTVTKATSFKAEGTITAGDGFVVAAKGDVTLQAGGAIALGDGFSVASGGRLQVAAGAMPRCP
ncbi:MAG TPA: M12 family metallo-peptidase [Thermoanaerobaculia bacterium]